MLILPSAHLAELDVRKLRDYCLNPKNSRGQHKALVFRAALGITSSDAEWLRDQILACLTTSEAVPGPVDAYGRRFRVDVVVARLDRQVVIRTAWIVAPETDEPRFVSCWVL